MTTATLPSSASLILPAAPPTMTVLVDTREQQPYAFGDYPAERVTLETGDYSIKGLEHEVCIERKTLEDFLGCVGGGRKRFERELRRMLSLPFRLLLIESSWAELEMGVWRSRVTPQQVIGSLLGWMAWGIPVVLSDNRTKGQEMAANWLRIVHGRMWKRVRGMVDQSSKSAS